MRGLLVAFVGLVLLGMTNWAMADVSGIYVAVSDRRVIMVQLVQSGDGKLMGLIQDTSIASDGAVKAVATNADGSTAGSDILLKPGSAWYGGVQASGTVSGNLLRLIGSGFALTAERSSFQSYQDALTRLRSVAAGQKQQIAVEKAARELTDKKLAIRRATDRLGADATKLMAAIERSPNFGEQAAANTARIEKMLRIVSSISDGERGQLSVAAGQVEVDTNQIEVARSQYAMGLNQIIQDAQSVVTSIRKMCENNNMQQIKSECDDAGSALEALKTAAHHGQTVFTPHKKKLEMELSRQDSLIRRFDN